MRQFYFLHLLLCYIVVTTTTTTTNVGLQTQLGVVYGRQTHISIEYLGYDQSQSLIDYSLNLP